LQLKLDSETGLYYYGARYYNPRLSIWYGVDPLGEKMPSWSPYAYAFDNPVRYTDPDGREPKDDYRLNKNGTFTFLKKTNDSFDRVYNNDKSKSIQITKGILQSRRTFKNTLITSFLGMTISKGNSYNSSFYFGKGKEAVGSMSRLNRFISNNSNKEFSFQKFENNSGVFGALSTDYIGTRVSSGNKVIASYMADPEMKMTYNSHNHPGGEGYAYPSGFKQSDRNYDFVPDLTNFSGDRANFIQLKARYGDRITDTFRINVGGTNQTVIYNAETTKVVTPTLTIGN